VGQADLHEHIIGLSEADEWQQARLEWELDSIYQTEESQTCPCGQFPINEICVLRNRRNGNTTEVGNVCVNNFIGLPSTKLFASVRRVAKAPASSFSEEMIEYAYSKRVINDWELKFYVSIRTKRNLSPKQREKKEQINSKILALITR
jgi:hypothetical protein